MAEEADFLVLQDGGRFAQPYASPEGLRDLLTRRLAEARASVRRRGEELDALSDVGQGGGPWRVLALILERRMSKGGRLEVLLEDGRGVLRATVGEEAEEGIANLLPDEPAIFRLEERGRRIVVRGVEATGAPVHPPSPRPKRRIYAAFVSDLHCRGSCEGLGRLVHMILEGGIEREVARNLRYIVLGGDVADCECEDPRRPYGEVGRLLGRLPEDVVKVIVPGECDAAPASLPQPPMDRRFRGALEEVPNAYLLGNPSLVSMSGVRVLIHHGQAVRWAMERLGIRRPALAMRKLLAMRTLAPTLDPMGYAAFPPGLEGMELRYLPDVFHAGHTHRADALRSENVLLLSTPSWNNGGWPRIPRVAIVDLSTLDVIWRGPIT